MNPLNSFYHIYLEDKCLFKNLNEEEFEVIWKNISVILGEEINIYREVSENPRISNARTLLLTI